MTHVYYGDYLQLDSLLNIQNTESSKRGTESHDETLFIITHQAYELWFKQIIHELNSVVQILNKDFVEEKELSVINSRLLRIDKIQDILISQIDIMETMTPMDFLEFRDLLIPASGFQSVQFRHVEILLGLKTHNRENIDREFFTGRLSAQDRDYISKVENEKGLLELLQSWLERMPFTDESNFNFWEKYKSCVDKMLESDKNHIESMSETLSPREIEIQLANLDSTVQTFDSLFNEKGHQKLIEQGKRKLSQKAILNALFILLYREQPLLNAPYNILFSLMNIDEKFTTWRYKHAMMAHRLLGTKIGTGGSSGHMYLKKAADNNKAFTDLFNLSTFLIPRNKIPKLPENLKNKLSFNY